MTDTIQFRRGTAATWVTKNPVLHIAEPGYETDTDKMKIGDGVTAWTSLPYFVTGGGSAGLTLTDNGDGTATISGGTGVVDNGDGTATISS